MRPTIFERLAVVLALLSVSAPGLLSQSQHSFDLDVPAARSSYWAIKDLGTANRLEADLEIIELRRDSQWRPTFQVELGAGDRTVAIRVVQERGDRDMVVSIMASERGKVTGEQILKGWRVERGQRFQFTLDWSTANALLVSSSGTERGRFTLGFVPTSLRVSASTGELFGHSIRLLTV